MNKQINSSTDTNNTVGAAHTRSFNVPMILEATTEGEGKMNAQKHFENYAAKQAMRLTVAKALQAANPHLIPGNTRVIAAKNIRIELKRAFPGVKFSVTSESFSMGDAISIRWTDGATGKQVEEITGKYKAGSFDGMTDCYDYESTNWTEAFGDAKYVSTSREYSLAFISATIAAIGAKWQDGELPTAEDLNRGACFTQHRIGIVIRGRI